MLEQVADTPAPEPVITDTPATEPVEIETPEIEATDSDQSTATVDDDPAEETKDEEPEIAKRFQADYTRKTQELAEVRKSLTERVAKLDQYVVQGEALVNTLAAEFQREFQGINWGELAANDPAAYVQKRHAFDERQRSLALAVGQLQNARAQQENVSKEETQQRLIDEQRKLLEKVPDWKDAKRAQAESAELREYLTDLGYDPEEVNGVTDHRAVLLARKAMLYDRMAAKTPKAAPVTKAPAPVSKAPTKASGPKDWTQMNDKEFAEWRKRQIAQRR